MSNTIRISAILAAAAIGVGFALTSSAPAKAETLLDKCNASSKALVENCCAAWVQQNGKPYWMSELGTTCGSSVVCRGKGGDRTVGVLAAVAKAPKNYCYLHIEIGTVGSSPNGPLRPKFIRG